MHTLIFISVYIILADAVELWRVEEWHWIFPPLFWGVLAVFIFYDLLEDA